MTGSWMLSSTIVAVLLALAAFVLARVTALYRGVSLRWVWALATAVSVAFALFWLSPSSPLLDDPSSRSSVGASNQAGAPTRASTVPAPATPRPSAVHARMPRGELPRIPRVALPHIPHALERVMLSVWIVASSVLLALLAVAAVRLHGERARWQWRQVANTRVLISNEFGPAIVGVLRPAIVLPEWVLTLDDASQRAIVAHEEEHRAARDPALLLTGLTALVLMPWNIGLWLSWRGLRRAIELDCDARVLARGIDGGEYARVLLGAWKSAHGRWLPSTAFAERASGLGARVEFLMRPEPRRRAMRTVVGTSVAAGLVFIACATPSPQRPMPDASAPYPLVIIDGVRRPDLPPRFRFSSAVVAETTTVPTYRIVYRGRQVEDTTTRALYPSMQDGTMMQTIDAPASVLHFGEQARYGAVLYYTKKYRDAGGAIIAPTEGNMAVRADTAGTPAAATLRIIYDRMFNGITLSPDRAAQARTIIGTEFAQARALSGPILAIWPRIVALNATRDAELRAVLTADADRATFDRHSLEGRPHGGPTIEQIVESEYKNLFVFPNENRAEPVGPTLPADAKAAASAIIRTTINDEMVIYARAPNAWNDTYEQRLALRLKRDVDLRALLPTEAERVKFDRFAKLVRGHAFMRP